MLNVILNEQLKKYFVAHKYKPISIEQEKLCTLLLAGNIPNNSDSKLAIIW